MSVVMRAWVIMPPRSPTSTTWLEAERCLSFSICGVSVVGFAVLPSKTSMATGPAVSGARASRRQFCSVPFCRRRCSHAGERAAAPLHVARRDVVEHEGAVAEMRLAKLASMAGLAHQQPVERRRKVHHRRPRRGRSASPRLEDAVAGDSARAAASFGDRRSMMRAIRHREHEVAAAMPSGPRRRSRPICGRCRGPRRQCPCGRGAGDGQGFLSGG